MKKIFKIFVYISAILLFQFLRTNMVSAESDRVVKFVIPSGVEIKIVEASCKDAKTSCRTEGKYGGGVTLGETPKTYLKEITITYRGKSYQLDTSGMFNAWGTRPLEYPGGPRYFGGYCIEGVCKFRGLFSDAVNTYIAEWVVINGVSTRTVFTGDSDIIEVFMNNIDPPQY